LFWISVLNLPQPLSGNKFSFFMNHLYLEATKYTPAVNFNPDIGKFEIAGISLPEDVLGFYEPVLDWLNEFAESMIDKSGGTHPPLQFIFKLNYYNSGSVRFLISLLHTIKRLRDHTTVKVEWFYEKDDIHLFDNGKELEELSGFKFDFIELG
jgi:hypothetical protein